MSWGMLRLFGVIPLDAGMWKVVLSYPMDEGQSKSRLQPIRFLAWQGRLEV